MLSLDRMQSRRSRVARASNLGEEYMDEFVNIESEGSEDFAFDASSTNRLTELDLATTSGFSLPTIDGSPFETQQPLDDEKS